MSDKGRALKKESMDWVNMDSWALDTSSPLRSRTVALYMMFNLAVDEHFYTSVPERDNPLRTLGIRIRELLDGCTLTRLAVPFFFIVSTVIVPQTTFIP